MVLVTVVLLLAAAACGLAYATRKLRRTRRPGEPPVVRGHLLWGSGKDFNEDAVTYLRRCTAEYGQVFTMRLLNYWMTVIADPHSFENFCHEKNFDFEPIQALVNGQIFGFQVPDYPRMRKFLGKTTRGPAIGRNLGSFSENLNRALDRLHATESVGGGGGGDCWASDGLKSLTTKTMFQAIFNQVFGPDKESTRFNYSSFWSSMNTFHKYFNYIWIGLPYFLFPEAKRSVQELLAQQPSCDEMVRSSDTSDYLRAAVEYMLSYDMSETAIKAHNVVYLHINANTFKIAFWCMHNLLRDRDALAAVKAEADELCRQKEQLADASLSETDAATTTPVALTLQEVDELKVLDSVISETFRLASGVFMVRHNRKDTPFTVASTGETFVIRGGDKVCLYPPAIHKDPEIFEDPLAFKYDRFVDRKFYKNGKELKCPLLPFGSICPGRKIALLQTKWFVLTMLSRYEMEILANEPPAELDVQYHGHEILPPTHDVQMRYRPLARPRLLALADEAKA